MPRRNTGTTQQNRHELIAPTAMPRPHIMQPINDELRHALTQKRVDTTRAKHEARELNTHGEGEQTVLYVNDDELCDAEFFILYIQTTPLPKRLKISEGTFKFNGQHHPRIWLDDFLTAIDAARCVDVNHHLVGNPKRKV
jgi:hypothetical protein